MSLRTALTNIHRDPLWWRKILIGGALMLTVVGYPWAAGLVIENLDNARKGFPTPLPPWRDWSTRYLIGLFATLIDIVFFVLPIFVIGLLFFCSGVATVAVGGGQLWWLVPLSGGILLIYELAAFASSVAPVGRLIYVEEGSVENALSATPLREALRPGARAMYARARLQSLPAYLPALSLAIATWFMIGAFWPAGVLLLWLACSALLYAHLAVAQLYVAMLRQAYF
jgi:hypothetical protein